MAIGRFALLLALGAAAAPAGAQQNLGFELAAADGSLPQGWIVRGDEAAAYDVDLDPEVVHAGESSLRIVSRNAGIARVTQRIAVESLRGRSASVNRLRFSGHLRTESSTPGQASLTLRVEGPGGFMLVDSRNGTATLGPDGWSRHVVETALPADALELTLGVFVRGMGTAWFDGLTVESFDVRELAPPAPAARRYFEVALDLMEQHSINRQTIDWPRFRTAALEQARGATTSRDTHVALHYALRNLGDQHSYLMTPETAASLTIAPVSNARTGRAPIEPRGSLLEGAYGYVSVPGFAGGAPPSQVRFAERLHEVIAELDAENPCGWIVDLTANAGGNLWPMLAGIGPLIGDGEVGASVYPDGSEKAFWYRDGKAGFGEYVQLRVPTPYHVQAPHSPVAVLVGPATASSGEAIFTAFSGRDNTLSFGAPTRGVNTGNRTFPLSDGAALVLTVAATRDRTGRVHAGAMEPDRYVPIGVDRRPRTAAVVEAAAEWLAEQPSCSNRSTS